MGPPISFSSRKEKTFARSSQGNQIRWLNLWQYEFISKMLRIRNDDEYGRKLRKMFMEISISAIKMLINSSVGKGGNFLDHVLSEFFCQNYGMCSWAVFWSKKKKIKWWLQWTFGCRREIMMDSPFFSILPCIILHGYILSLPIQR